MGEIVQLSFKLENGTSPYTIWEKKGRKNESKNERFRRILNENNDMEITISELKKENDNLRKFEIYAKDQLSGKGEESTEISEKPCKELGHKKNGEPFCIDPTSPISSEARRNLNHEVCKRCKEKRAKQLLKIQEKEDEAHQKALAKAKEETRKAVEQLKKPSRGRDEYAGSSRVNYDTCAPNGAPDSW